MKYEEPNMEVIDLGEHIDTITLSVGTGAGDNITNPFAPQPADVDW